MKYFQKLKDCFKCPISICFLGIELIFLILTCANNMSLKDFCITFSGYILFNLLWSWIALRAEKVNGYKLL